MRCLSIENVEAVLRNKKQWQLWPECWRGLVMGHEFLDEPCLSWAQHSGKGLGTLELNWSTSFGQSGKEKWQFWGWAGIVFSVFLLYKCTEFKSILIANYMENFSLHHKILITKYYFVFQIHVSEILLTREYDDDNDKRTDPWSCCFWWLRTRGENICWRETPAIRSAHAWGN